MVTQPAKKEMSNGEKAAQTKLNQRVKFEHAKEHRKVKMQKKTRKEEKMFRKGIK